MLLPQVDVSSQQSSLEERNIFSFSILEIENEI